jgi:hypothetical protein
MYETLIMVLCVAGLFLWIVLEYRWRKKDWEAKEKAALEARCASVRNSLHQVATTTSKSINGKHEQTLSRKTPSVPSPARSAFPN